MESRILCPECGVELPANAPQGLCPRCLANMGLGLLAADATQKSDIQIERTGAMLGRYRLLQKIGEGGFGVVFMAEQVAPVQRKVALKIIKAGMDTKEVIARFEAERQAIALMDHPNIARALDAGSTEAGRPYFVMELVHGIPITEYCDQKQLSTQERLQLFIKVCHAVQHAHQKGLIHRDLKPSNVLVTEHDGEPVPKVIDFGVAKALGQKLTEKTLFTAFHHMIGTPAYMSPEQAALSGMDIDTRADIYSLGVLLYELLTGATPFDGETLQKAGLDEIRRMIREIEPPRPSTRLQTLGEKLTHVAKQRRAAPATLSRLIRGDLDWIVMRCLEKDRQRRYETANGLATDLARHFANEPISARAPGTAYRFQKFVRRHKRALVAGSSVLAILGISIWLFLKEKEARRIAERAGKQTTEKLYESYLAQARGSRLSGQPGQYFNTMETIAKAAALWPSLELRNEAIACFALDDLRMIPIDAVNPSRPGAVIFDQMLERFAVLMPDGDIAVRQARNDPAVTMIPTRELGVRWLHGFSPNGRYITFHTERANHCAWDLRKHRMALRDLRWESAMLFCPTEDSLVAHTSPGGETSFFELESGRETRRALRVSAGSVAKAFDRTGLRLAYLNNTALVAEIVNVKLGEVIATASLPATCESMALSDDGKCLAAACHDNCIYLWNADSGKLVRTLTGHDDRIVNVAFNHAGTLLATTSWDDSTRVWDTHNGTELLNFPGSSYQLQFSLDDRRLGPIVQNTNFGTFELVNHPEYRRLSPASRSGKVGTLTIGPDNRLIAATVEGQVRLWDFEIGREIGVLPEAGCVSVVFTVDGKNLITCGGAGLARWPIHRESGGLVDKVLIGPRQQVHPKGNIALDYASMSQDGSHIVAVVRGSGRARVIDLANPEKLVELGPHSGMRHISMSSDGKWMATGTWQGSGVKVWDVESGRLLRELPEPTHADVLISPDGRWLVTAGREYHLWETATWQPGPAIVSQSRNFPVGVMAFSGNSELLAIGYARRGVRLIETKTGRTLADFEPAGLSKAQAICFSGDGTRLIAINGVGQVHVWNLRLIRQRLSALRLDWDTPPYSHDVAANQLKALQLEVITVK